MGQPKQLLCVGGRTALEQTLRAVRDSHADEVVLVLGFAADQIQRQLPPALLDGVKVVVNPQHESGIASSLRAGLSLLAADVDATLIVLADQPLVRAATMDGIIDKYRVTKASIIIPLHNGQRGNPVLLSRAIFPEAMALTGDTGCRALFASHTEGIAKVEVDDPGILQDMDTRADYDRLRELAE
jgi:molybdenum cofactor cytidylyltransferase